MRARRTGREFSEPSLDEMLDDPVVQIVMARDGVKRREIVALMGRMQTQRLDTVRAAAKDLVPGE